MTEWAVPAQVVRVIDGDSLIVTADLGWRVHITSAVRLHGVDCPELDTDEGKAARDFVKDALPVGAPITLISHKLLGQSDKYGRVLASVTLPSGRDLSTVLLEDGHATAYEMTR